MKAKPIYIEIDMHCSMDTIWKHTQDPKIHEQWDLRFTEIDYLPKEKEEELTRFNYITRLGFGINICGTGETRSKDSANGIRTSTLKFGSEMPVSLINKGSGYWKYIPVSKGVKFVTSYDYQTRFGSLGALFDKLVFRPIITWATAWSFDALKLWLEKGIHPSVSTQRYITVLIANIALALIWIYQGLIPKILFSHLGEQAIIRQSGIVPGNEHVLAIVIGYAEVLFGSLFLIFPFKRRLHQFNIVLMLAFAISMLGIDITYFALPFNPLVLNVALIALSLTTLINLKQLPQALHCKFLK